VTGRKREKKLFSLGTVFALPEWKNSERDSKKFKNIILASFQAKTVQDKTKKREKFSCSEPFSPVMSDRISKKIAKKFEKFKNIILASFEAKTGPDRSKKTEKNFLVRNCFYPTRASEVPKKIARKFKKLKKSSWLHFSRNGAGQAEKEKKKILAKNPFHPTRAWEFPEK